MFERFTKDAREVVVGAQSAARELGALSIGSEHLLQVLVELGGPVADALTRSGLDTAALHRAANGAEDAMDPDALAAIGIDLAAVRQLADEVFGPGALDQPRAKGRAGKRGHVPFTKDAKKVLEVALREAIALRDREIRTDHLVLAMTALTDSRAHRLLTACGADPADVRTRLVAHRTDVA